MSSNVVESRPWRGTAPAAQPEAPPEPGGHLAALREIPAWAISLGVHLILLVLLHNIIYSTPAESRVMIDSAIEELEQDAFNFDTTVSDQIGSDSLVNVLSPSKAAATQAGDNPQQELERQLETEFQIQMPDNEPLIQPNEAEFVELIDTQGGTEHTGGVEGAIDRLTYEIAGSLKERKTLVVWLFDASLSLEARREAIAERFQNVYKQLGHLDVGADRALKTAVASYGQDLRFLTEDPVDDVSEAAKAVRDIENDVSGKEYVFNAIRTVTRKWLPYRTKMRRNMMVIIVTDERGDDYELLEEVIQFNRRYGIRVYCVGNAAPFGHTHGYHTWTYSDGSTEEIPVDQGPETVAPERLALPFWGTSSRDLERMSSSFGPYALSRLCSETGGMYFISDENLAIHFDPAGMRQYQPGYRPIKDYERELQNNLAKGALVRAALMTEQLQQSDAQKIPNPQTAFRADSDNILRQQITEAQKPFAVLDYTLEELHKVLAAGEKERPNLAEARWQAGYDLAMGRVLALRARALGYNATLAEMKAAPKPFEKKESNQWRLVPSREITSGPAVKKLAQQATEYLTRVIDEHPGTPWAELAKREVSVPMGWAWREGTMDIPDMRRGSESNDPRLLLAEEERRREERRKREELRKRERPKL